MAARLLALMSAFLCRCFSRLMSKLNPSAASSRISGSIVSRLTVRCFAIKLKQQRALVGDIDLPANAPRFTSHRSTTASVELSPTAWRADDLREPHEMLAGGSVLNSC